MAKILEYRVLSWGQLEYERAAKKFSVRSGDWTRARNGVVDAAEAAEVQEFAELVDSIERFGQIEPIGVRRKGGTDLFEVIYGWRRFAALNLIHHRTGVDVKIHALVWDCSDVEAKQLQLIQSLTTARVDSPDLAVALKHVAERTPWTSDQQLSLELGANPAFVAIHLRVARNASPELLDRWIHDQFAMSLMAMDQIAMNVEPDRQTLAYEAMRDKQLFGGGDDSTSPVEVVGEHIDSIIDGIQGIKHGLGELVKELAIARGGASDVTKAATDGEDDLAVELALKYPCSRCGAATGVKCTPECKASEPRVPLREPFEAGIIPKLKTGSVYGGLGAVGDGIADDTEAINAKFSPTVHMDTASAYPFTIQGERKPKIEDCEIVAHLGRPDILFVKHNGAYRFLREETVSDAEYIATLEGMVISKHTALKLMADYKDSEG